MDMAFPFQASVFLSDEMLFTADLTRRGRPILEDKLLMSLIPYEDIGRGRSRGRKRKYGTAGPSHHHATSVASDSQEKELPEDSGFSSDDVVEKMLGNRSSPGVRAQSETPSAIRGIAEQYQSDASAENESEETRKKKIAQGKRPVAAKKNHVVRPIPRIPEAVPGDNTDQGLSSDAGRIISNFASIARDLAECQRLFRPEMMTPFIRR